MNLKMLMGLLVYWIAFIIIFGNPGFIYGENGLENPFIAGDYVLRNATLNTTFDPGDIDPEEGGFLNFFNGVVIIFSLIARFLGLVLFGITPVLSGGAQVIFTLWQLGISLFTIGWIADAIWSG